MALLDLPLETIEQICRLYCAHCSWDNATLLNHSSHGVLSSPCTVVQPLVNLSSTCRVLRAIARPILYHDIRTGSVYRLLRTLSSNPELAAQVRALKLDPNEDHGPGPDDDVLTIEAAASRLGANLPADLIYSWRRDLRRPVDEPNNFYYLGDLVLMLVAQSLEAFRTTIDFDAVVGDLLVSQGDGKSVVAFPRLRRVWFSHWDTEGGMDIDRDRLGAFLGAAPNLEGLTVSMCTNIERGLSLRSLRELYFDNSCLEVEGLANVVTACPKLERFEYWSGGAIINEAVEEEILPDDVWEVLSTRAGTLRQVSLDFCHHTRRVDRGTEPHAQTGGVAHDTWEIPAAEFDSDMERVVADFAGIGVRCDKYLPQNHFGWPGY